MKRMILSLMVGLLLTTGSAFAVETYWVGDVGNPVGPTDPYQGVLNFDWLSTGSGLAVNYGPAGTAQPAGFEFDFLYQAKLTSLSDGNGNPITTTDLNVTHEYTFVATVPEVVIVGPAPPLFATVFNTDTTPPATSLGNKWSIYYDGVGIGGAQSKVSDGTGFNDGKQIAYGYFLPSNNFTSSYIPQNAAGTSGTGSINDLLGIVDWFDAAFFGPDYATGLPIFGLRIEGTINYPPLDSITASFFDGNDGYATYIPGANDIMFKVDASSKFTTVVPEPSTIILLGVGLLGLGGLGVMRRKR